jgi:acyl-CoA thioesterase-1
LDELGILKGVSLDFRKLIYAVLILVFQPVVGCSDAVTDPETIASDVRSAAENSRQSVDQYDSLVVVFGDSLYAGYGLEQAEGFAPELQRALAESGIRARVVNAGVSGDTTAAGQQRLAFTLDGLERPPDLVLVGLGGNDMLRGINPSQTRANLIAILSELNEREIEAMLTGMIAAPNLGADYGVAFNPIYRELSTSYDVTLYPFFLDGVIDQPDLMLPDGIHPNDQGIDLIVERVAPLVVAELTD